MSADQFLQDALNQAKLAGAQGDVPVGAVLVKDDVVVAAAHNQKEQSKDCTHHAELLSIQQACQVVGDWRLSGFTLYSTLEPCLMCAGAILHARIDRVVFGAKDHKWGAAGTICDLFKPGLVNHHCEAVYVETADCQTILTEFFKRLR